MSSMFSTIHTAIKEQQDIYFFKNIITPWCLEHDAFYCVPAQFLIRMVEFNSKTKKFAILVSWFIISQVISIRKNFNFKDFILEYIIILHKNLILHNGYCKHIFYAMFVYLFIKNYLNSFGTYHFDNENFLWSYFDTFLQTSILFNCSSLFEW